MRLAAAAAALAAVLSLAACGRQPVSVRDPAEPRLESETRQVHFPDRGVTLAAPLHAHVKRLFAPGVFRIPLGVGFVSSFAFRRSEPLPKGAAQLAAARRRLLKEVQGRDRSFRVDRSRTLRVAGGDAIEITGRQTISRQPLETRSVHVFKGHGEYVFELLAPPPGFRRVERAVFEPILRSLKLSGRVKQIKRVKKRAKPKQP